MSEISNNMPSASESGLGARLKATKEKAEEKIDKEKTAARLKNLGEVFDQIGMMASIENAANELLTKMIERQGDKGAIAAKKIIDTIEKLLELLPKGTTPVELLQRFDGDTYERFRQRIESAQYEYGKSNLISELHLNTNTIAEMISDELKHVFDKAHSFLPVEEIQALKEKYQ